MSTCKKDSAQFMCLLSQEYFSYDLTIQTSANDCRYFDKEFTKEALNETPVESKGNIENYSYDPDNFKFSVLSDDTNYVNRVK